ncbi:cell division inhibition protein DicB, partial [Escherichia coli]|nr:cell division inhibition protein DicB [Escherichia coli]MBC1117552.1 cell division inhibition protein DicB [Escherichia coli]
ICIVSMLARLRLMQKGR